MTDGFPSSKVFDCSHCGNRTPHTLEFQHTNLQLYDELDSGEQLLEPFTWLAYSCGTCNGINSYGAFFTVDIEVDEISQAKLHPRGSDLLPPLHTLSPNRPVPANVLRLYEEAWPLRHRAPAAFIGQVRRLLEYVCKDQDASGKNLFSQLQDLSTKGVFPGYFSQITDLLRKVGNMGAHAAQEELTIWDAELIDDFFRSIVEYVYIAPARIKRMEQRLKKRKTDNG